MCIRDRLRNEHKNITSVIDPGEAEPVINFLNNKRWHLDEVINTHHHHDHVGGNKELSDIYKSTLIAPFYEKNRISNIDILVSDNETINITGIPTKVFHTPGTFAITSKLTLISVCFVSLLILWLSINPSSMSCFSNEASRLTTLEK